MDHDSLQTFDSFAFPFVTSLRPGSRHNALRIYTKPQRPFYRHDLDRLTESHVEERRFPQQEEDDAAAAEPGTDTPCSLSPPLSPPSPWPSGTRDNGDQSVFTAKPAARPAARPRPLSRSRPDRHGVHFTIDTATSAASYDELRTRAQTPFAQRMSPLMALVSHPSSTSPPPRATFDAGPDSPPELTSSKSSKSSSFRTRSSEDDSSPGSGPHDASNFEDITLDDILAHQANGSADSLALEPVGLGKDAFGDRDRDRHGSLQLPRTRSTASSRHASISSTSTVTMRDLTGAPRPHFPSLKRQVQGAANGLNLRGSQSALHLPAPGSPRRGFASPLQHPAHQGPGGPPLPPPQKNRSRSPSPTFLQSFGLSAQHIPRRSSSRSSLRSNSTIGPVGRRASWQPGRKTVKELEDEYDDNDDDMPEDAIVWNIPLSPRPPESRSVSQSPERVERKRSERSTSSRRSSLRSPGPQQELQTRSPPESGSILALRRQRSTPAILEDADGLGTLKPRPGQRPSPLQHAATADGATMVAGTLAHRSRTKSWTEALGELSSEARQLTAALEAFETQQETKANTSVTTTAVDETASPQHGDSGETTQTDSAAGKAPWSADPSARKHTLRRSASTAELRQKVTLPPIRKGDMLLDPLPISKEKEKVLSRTRPSWLPPKSQKEEKRHLREYKRMMEASLEAEKKREQRTRMEQEAKEAQEASLLRIWENTVLADWEAAMAEPRTRELWWRGVPAQHRGAVWARAVGNELHLTETSYAAALARAKEERRLLEHAKAQVGPDAALPKDVDEDRLQQYRAMHADVLALASLPGYHIFAASAPLHDPLMDLLAAYSSYRSDVGYVTGLHLPAALLLTTLTPPANAFVILANLLNRPVPMSYLLTTLRHRHHQHHYSSDNAQGSFAAPPAPIASTHALILKQLANRLPSLHAHLTSPKLGLRPQQYLDPLLSSLFCDPRRVGVERALRLWDVMAFEGDKVLVRGAVAVLASLEGGLYGGRDEVLALLGWTADVPDAVAREMGDVEAWMRALREAGKVDKRED